MSTKINFEHVILPDNSFGSYLFNNEGNTYYIFTSSSYISFNPLNRANELTENFCYHAKMRERTECVIHCIGFLKVRV